MPDQPALSDAQLAQLVALNTDHHVRMAAMPLSPDAAVLDLGSRDRLLTAMVGCQQRFTMHPPPRKKMPKINLLELGAGSAGDWEHLMGRLGADNYTGIEVVPELAARTRERGVNVVNHAIETMPKTWNRSFHWIYSRHVMEHVADVDLALAALKRVLAPSGIIGQVTPYLGFPDGEPAHLTQLHIEEWIEAMARHGLRAVYALLATHAVPEAHIVAIHDNWPIEGR